MRNLVYNLEYSVNTFERKPTSRITFLKKHVSQNIINIRDLEGPLLLSTVKELSNDNNHNIFVITSV